MMKNIVEYIPACTSEPFPPIGQYTTTFVMTKKIYAIKKNIILKLVDVC